MPHVRAADTLNFTLSIHACGLWATLQICYFRYFELKTTMQCGHNLSTLQEASPKKWTWAFLYFMALNPGSHSLSNIMYFEEYKIALLANAIAEPNTYFTSRDIHFSGAGQIFTLAMLDLCTIQESTGTSMLGKAKHLLGIYLNKCLHSRYLLLR